GVPRRHPAPSWCNSILGTRGRWNRPAAPARGNDLLLNHGAGAAPARFGEKAEWPKLFRLIERPVNEHRAADDQIARHKSPDAPVGAVVAIVAHHEIAIRRHDLIKAAVELLGRLTKIDIVSF